MHLVNRKYHNCQIFNAHGTVESEANHNKFLSVLSLTAFPRKCSNCFIFLWWRLLPHYRSVAWVNFYWSSSYSVQGRAQWEKCDNFYTCEWPRSEGLCAYVVCDFSSFLRFFRLYKLINLLRWHFLVVQLPELSHVFEQEMPQWRPSGVWWRCRSRRLSL